MAGHFDVAVVGAGLAGLLASDRLASAGARVVLFDPSSPPVPASTRSMGLVAFGWIDSPARLADGLGEDVAHELHRWSATAVDSLRRTVTDLGVAWRPTGSLRLAMDPLDAASWTRSVELLQRWGLGGGVSGLTEADIRALGPSPGVLGGARVPVDAIVDLPALLHGLRARFLGHGGEVVRIRCRVDAGLGAPEIVGEDGARRTAEIVVAAPGAEASSVHPFFGTCVYPVRLQGLRAPSGTLAVRQLDLPVLARHRFEAIVPGEDGALEMVGCRWAEQPEMEAGVRDDASTSSRIARAQEGWLRDQLAVEVTNAERWSGIAAYTCDGLPIVGPLPGAPRVIAAVGWSGWGLSLAAAATDAICGSILGELPPGDHTPYRVTARRLL